MGTLFQIVIQLLQKNMTGDRDGFSETDGDCDDSDPYTYPGAAGLDSASNV